MKRIIVFDFVVLTLLVFFVEFIYAAVDPPHKINYQGYVTSGGTAYGGTGYFKFMLADDSGDNRYWSNDDNSAPIGYPGTALSTTVSSGVFNVILGAGTSTNQEILTSVFADHSTVYLHVWFSTDNVTFEKLSPNKQVVSSAYAFNAYGAYTMNGGTVENITSLTVANDVDIGSYNLRAASLTADGLTSGRVVFATTNGQLTDDADLTFATDTLTATKIGAFTLTGKLTAGTTEIEGSNFDVDGGAIDGTAIGGSSAAAGTFTTATANDFVVNNAASPYLTRFGYQAGNTNTGVDNSFIGYQAGLNNTTGTDNTTVGYQVLYTNSTGIRNTSMGYQALYNNTDSGNTAVGYTALFTNTAGVFNTAIGSDALYTNSTGSHNTVIGFGAGYNTTGSDNVFIGYQAGYNETGSNKLYIDNSNTSTPLIYGMFDNNMVGINTNSLSYTLDVGGSIRTGKDGTDGKLVIYSDETVAGGDQRVEFQPHSNMTQDTIYTLPSAFPGGNALLQSDTSGNLTWNVKAFILNHPLNNNKLLVHACLEGPENGVYYRGIVTIDEPNKVLEIELPSYFEHLVRKEDRTVLATVIEDYENFIPDQMPFFKVSTIKDGRFKIASSAPCKVSWEVKGVRRDLGKLPVEIEKDDYLNNKYPELERRDITKFKDVSLWK